MPLTVKSPVITTFVGSPTVIVCPDATVTISLAVPCTVNTCVFKSTEPSPVEPDIPNVAAIPVNAEPSPWNEPLNDPLNIPFPDEAKEDDRAYDELRA